MAIAPALIGVGGSFLANYLAQRAEEERQRRAAQQSLIQNEGQQKQNALSAMLAQYGQVYGG